MPVVTYKGPKDHRDPTTRLRVPREDFGGRADLLLRVGQPVPVSEKAAKVLRTIDGHEFEIASVRKKKGEDDE